MAPTACDHANILDPVLATPPYAKSGFAFIYTGEKGIVVVPLNSLTGVQSFCEDDPAVIHFDTSGTPAASPAACDALPALQ